jgi:hypothetical protein
MPTFAISYEGQALEMSPTEVTWPQTWVGTGFSGELELLRHAFFNLPPNLGPAMLAKIRIGSRLGLTAWNVEATYSTKRKDPINKDAVEGESDPVADDEEIDYGIGTESRNIKKSLATVGYPAFFGPEPDEGGLIGVDKDGVQGVDINYGLVSFAITKQFQRQDITPELREAWEELSDPQHINDDTFRGYAAGEVRFDGISNCKVSGGPTHLIPVTFAFSRRKNLTDVDMGNSIVIPEVKGWQVIDPRFKEKEDTANDKMMRETLRVYVHDVLPEGDFSRLGIATS